MNDTDRWERTESLIGEFNIGYGTGASCYLIDDHGHPRSEGYHEIRATTIDAGPSGNIKYIGTSGTSENRISPIPEYYLDTETDHEED